MASLSVPDERPQQQKLQHETAQAADWKISGGGGSGDDDSGELTKKALRRGHKALLRMRVAVLRSIKSLARDRVPAHSRRAMEKRYADLVRRVSMATMAMDAAVADADGDGGCPTAAGQTGRAALVPDAVFLLAGVYRLEKDLNDVAQERDRLVAGEGSGGGLGQFITHATRYILDAISVPRRQ